MRRDMYKVICERPRRGGKVYDHHPYRRAKRVVLVDGDCYDEFSGRTKVPMKPQAMDWDDYKEFNDYLNPLYRFIEKQVGRPWDDVYSEICENINLDSTTRRHVREHVDRYVEVNVRLDENGDPCKVSGYRVWSPVYAELSPLYEGDLYKDPVDGILKKAGIAKNRAALLNSRKNKDEKQAKTTKPFTDGNVFKLKPVGDSHVWFKYYRTTVKRTRTVVVGVNDRGVPTYRHEEYLETVEVRDTASKREIRDYGLNDQ